MFIANMSQRSGTILSEQTCGENVDNNVHIILSLLGKYKIDDCIDKIILDILSSLCASNKDIDISLLNVLHSVLTFKLGETVSSSSVTIPDYGKILNACLLILKQKHEINCYSVSRLFKILDQTLLLVNNELFLSSIIDIILKCKDDLLSVSESGNLEDDKLNLTFKPEVAVRLLETILHVLLIKQKQNIVSCEFETIYEMIADMHDLILRLSVCNVGHISTDTVLYIVPKYVMYNTKSDFLENLWRHLETNLQNDDTLQSRVFYVLCGLVEFYLCAESEKIHSCFSIINENNFWKMLQNGLTQSNPLVRKQALYLMKRAVHTCSADKKYVNPSCSDAVFWWNTALSSNIWDKFFLIIETIEEKQVHIIKPVLPLVDYLVELCITPCQNGLELHESWLLCVLHRIITHDSTTIIKWGILSFIQIYKKIQFSKHCILNFMGTFINAINDSSLYVKNSDISMSEIGKELQDMFVFVAESCCYDDCEAFFCCMLDKMTEISWAPVPLLNIAYALSCTPHTSVWDNRNLKVVRNFMTEALRCQYIFIRGAVQCMFLDATIHLTKSDKLDIYTIADLLGSFREAESLKRGTTAWNNTVQWLKTVINKNEASEFVNIAVSVQEGDSYNKVDLTTKSIVRMIILLCDAELLLCYANNEDSSLIKSLCFILYPFINCESRLYADEMSQVRSLEMIVALLDESHANTNDLEIEDKVRKTILNHINAMLDQIFFWLCRKMLFVSQLRDYYLVRSCLKALDTFSAELASLPKVETNIVKLHKAAVEVTMSSTASPISRYFSTKTLAIISHCMRQHTHCGCKMDSCSILRTQKYLIDHIVTDGRLNKPLVKEETEEKLTRDLQTLWGKLASGYIEAGWSIVEDFVHTCHSGIDNILSLRNFTSLISDASTSLEIGGWNVLVPVMKVVSKVLPSCLATEDVDAVLKLISTCWNVTFELRKTELFWTAMKAFIEMLFQPFTLITPDYQECLQQYSKKIFLQGQAITGLYNLLITQLQSVISDSSAHVLDHKWNMLVDGLTFGPVHRKDQRIIIDACLFITSLGEKVAVNSLVPNDCYADSEVRMRALQLVLQLCMETRSHHVAGQIVETLIEKDRVESACKARYYSDSHIHRVKHRILQSLLILEPLLDSEEAKKLLLWLQDSLLKESQQPSVRYQQEWLVVRILLHYSSLKECLWRMFWEAQQKRPGSICSFIAIIYHIVNVLEDEMFVDSCISKMLPLCMAQHFSIRLYAQTTVQKLLALCKKQDHLKQLSEKYAVVESCLKTSMDYGNSIKNAQKLQEDFYFSTFHPVTHYSFETIFHDLPRLANITQDEWIPLDVARRCGIKDTGYISMNSKDISLKKFSVAAWVLKSSGLAEEEDSAVEVQTNFQKKLIPWRSLIPDDELRPSAVEPTAKREGLIVVASLIDRLPNLGGLSRTCEVFGVSEYVIRNLKYIEDKQFQNLSVTAEQWIPISEVKPHVLPKYLESKKKDGYTLIGAEQTASSTRLSDVKFPYKTLLLLGNEKEGIPANLLPVLDLCVEIPQHGVVRSLNVHVTGALFVWEYIRQHTPVPVNTENPELSS